MSAQAASTQESCELAPAGWYPDPLGMDQVRWWNGFGWSNHIEQRRPELSVAPGYTVRLVGAPE
jgi:hypothetical protein